jgi:hypothetical protein
VLGNCYGGVVFFTLVCHTGAIDMCSLHCCRCSFALFALEWRTVHYEGFDYVVVVDIALCLLLFNSTSDDNIIIAVPHHCSCRNGIQ